MFDIRGADLRMIGIVPTPSTPPASAHGSYENRFKCCKIPPEGVYNEWTCPVSCHQEPTPGLQCSSYVALTIPMTDCSLKWRSFPEENGNKRCPLLQVKRSTLLLLLTWWIESEALLSVTKCRSDESLQLSCGAMDCKHFASWLMCG